MLFDHITLAQLNLSTQRHAKLLKYDAKTISSSNLINLACILISSQSFTSWKPNQGNKMVIVKHSLPPTFFSKIILCITKSIAWSFWSQTKSIHEIVSLVWCRIHSTSYLTLPSKSNTPMEYRNHKLEIHSIVTLFNLHHINPHYPFHFPLFQIECSDVKYILHC